MQHFETIEQAVRDALTNPETARELANAFIPATLSDGRSLQVDQVVEKSLSAAADIAVKRIREASLVTFFPEGVIDEGIQFSVESHYTATIFLWVSTASFVDDPSAKEAPELFKHTKASTEFRAQLVYDYGKKWAWRDRKSGEVYDEIGPQWGLRNGIGVNDDRTLNEVGIEPGMELEYMSMVHQEAQAPSGGR